EFQRGMERGEAVAQADRVGVAESWVGGGGIDREVTGPGHGVIGAGVGQDLERGSAGRIGPVLDGNDRVEGVIGAAQEDEQDFLELSVRSGRADGAFGQGAFHDERYVHEGGQGDTQTDFEAAVQEGSACEDIDVLHRLDCPAYCSWNRGEVISMATSPRTRAS